MEAGPAVMKERWESGPGLREAAVLLLVWIVVDRVLSLALRMPMGHAASRSSVYWSIALLRLVEIAALLGYWRARGRSLAELGLTGPHAARGWAQGVAWAAAACGLVLLLEITSRLAFEGSFLRAVTGRPARGAELLALAAAGGLVGPVFEELLFRGILYHGLRRSMSAVPAIALASLVFASAHQWFSGVHPVQAAGGLLFCTAYEMSRSLWSPLVVHVTGNLAIFLLPLFLP